MHLKLRTSINWSTGKLGNRVTYPYRVSSKEKEKTRKKKIGKNKIGFILFNFIVLE